MTQTSTLHPQPVPSSQQHRASGPALPRLPSFSQLDLTARPSSSRSEPSPSTAATASFRMAASSSARLSSSGVAQTTVRPTSQHSMTPPSSASLRSSFPSSRLPVADESSFQANGLTMPASATPKGLGLSLPASDVAAVTDETPSPTRKRAIEDMQRPPSSNKQRRLSPTITVKAEPSSPRALSPRDTRREPTSSSSDSSLHSLAHAASSLLEMHTDGTQAPPADATLPSPHVAVGLPLSSDPVRAEQLRVAAGVREQEMRRLDQQQRRRSSVVNPTVAMTTEGSGLARRRQAARDGKVPGGLTIGTPAYNAAEPQAPKTAPVKLKNGETPSVLLGPATPATATASLGVPAPQDGPSSEKRPTTPTAKRPSSSQATRRQSAMPAPSPAPVQIPPHASHHGRHHSLHVLPTAYPPRGSLRPSPPPPRAAAGMPPVSPHNTAQIFYGPPPGCPPPQSPATHGPPMQAPPPSSKAAFLDLFSNFYDSLGDSRVLSRTLDDQLRRSATLLQTLHDSARTLEDAVDRRTRSFMEEVSVDMQGLDRRLARIEQALSIEAERPMSRSQQARRSSGAGSSTSPPPPASSSDMAARLERLESLMPAGPVRTDSDLTTPTTAGMTSDSTMGGRASSSARTSISSATSASSSDAPLGTKFVRAALSPPAGQRRDSLAAAATF